MRRSARSRMVSLSPRRSEPNARTARSIRSAPRERLALGVDRQQRSLGLGQRIDVGHGQREMQAGRAAQRSGLPRIAPTDHQHRCRAGSRCDPHHRAEIAGMRGILEQHDRRRLRCFEGARHVDLLAAPRSPARRSPAASAPARANVVGADLLDNLLQLTAQIRREIPRQPHQHRTIGGAGKLDPRAETQGMLERVKAFQNGQRRIGARDGKALDQGPRVAHRPIRSYAALSISRTIDSPITEVDTLALPGCMMSAVRSPPASTRPTASSSRSAAWSWSNE